MMENNAGISKKPVVKVHVILLVAGILVLSAVLAILVAYQAGLIYGDFSELARVNGEPVYVKEYKMKLLSNTTEVINYFSQSYAVETKENFRTDSYSGEAPVEMARKRHWTTLWK